VSQEKRYKKGEKIYLEGDQLTGLFIIQSGKVAISIERGGQKTEVDQPIVGNVIGEQGVFGFPKQVFDAEALSEVKVIEMPLEPIKMVFEKSPAPYKLFVKALGDELRRLRGIIRTLKMESDTTACPPRFIPRLCAILTLVGKHIGQTPKVDPNIPAYKRDEERAKNPTHKDTDLILSFNSLKIYTSRMFLESNVRMQSFCDLLGKLGYITTHYEKNEETELDELVDIRIHDLQTIEHFGEFYQHNLFKAGKSEIIIIDKLALQIAGAFAALANDVEPDRNGVVKLDYKNFIEKLKNKYFIDFKENHVGLLEKKGLYMKRQSVNDVVFVSYDKYEWQSTYKFWQIIQEIDRWNETGRVNLTENLNEYKSAGPAKCPGCSELIAEAKNFCTNCGHKLAA
jgi:hypothetical protein